MYKYENNKFINGVFSRLINKEKEKKLKETEKTTRSQDFFKEEKKRREKKGKEDPAIF